MRKISALLVALLFGLALAACSPREGGDGIFDPDASPTGDVVIEFMGWGDAKELENYQTLVNKFMEENQNITVNYKGESASTYMNTLKNRANNLPDLFYMPDYDFLEWVANGKLMDITRGVSEEEIDKLWPQAVDEYYFDPNSYLLGKGAGAKLYGLPKDLGPFTLVYNKELLDRQIEKYSLDSEAIYAMLSPTEPMTWNQFRSLLKQIDPDGGADSIYGISHYEIEAAVYSNDADFFNADATEQRITDKNFYDAIQFIADLCLVDNVMPSASDQVSTNGYQRFKAQNCVFSFMGPWDCAEFWESANFTYDIVPVPYNGENPNAKSCAWVGSMAYCISAKTSQQKAAAALKLAKYLCLSEEGQRSFYELGQQVPNIVDMANDEYINDSKGLLAGKSPATRSVWVDTINGYGANDKVGGKVRARYYTYYSDWYTLFTEQLTSSGMWKGDVKAQKACEDFAPLFQDALDEMQGNLG